MASGTLLLVVMLSLGHLVSGPLHAKARQATTTTATTSTTSTTAPDPNVGRRLGVRTPASTGEAFQSGPLWIGAAFALAGAGGIAYALGVRPRTRRAQTWPKRRGGARRYTP